jgi:rhodanese-related sulfurtransferase
MISASQRFLLVLIALMFQGAATANTATQTPLELPGASVVSAEQVKRLVDAGALLVDTRVGNEFAEAHIRGSVNVPYKEVSRKAVDFDASQDRFDLSKLPSDKSKPVILYCNSGDCWRSYKASIVTVRAGYRQVYWFRGGFPEWKKKGLPID